MDDKLQFKQGRGWKCCYDAKAGTYTAQTGGGVNCTLFEITSDVYDRVDDPGLNWLERLSLIGSGRKLFMSVNDRCGPPYTIVFDSDYEKLCPWSDAVPTGRTWSEELTDAAVEVLESEKDNRPQRRARRKEREGR